MIGPSPARPKSPRRQSYSSSPPLIRADTVRRRRRVLAGGENGGMVSSSQPIVFLDTCVLKHAIRGRELLRRQSGALTWQLVEEDPVEMRGVATEMRGEINLLDDVAAIARVGSVKLVTHLEAVWELAGNLLVPGRMRSVFDGISVDKVGNPVPYARLLTPFPGSGASSRSLTSEFLCGLQHPRYMELRRACGAYQGERQAPPNQLMDAFLVWCADDAGADFFLTTDLKLVRSVRACKSVRLDVRVTAPSELLAAVSNA